MVPLKAPFNLLLGRRVPEGALDGVHSSLRIKKLGHTSQLKHWQQRSTKSTSKMLTNDEESSDYFCTSKREGLDFQHRPSLLKGSSRVGKGGIGCCTKYNTPYVKTDHPTSNRISQQKNPSSKPFKIILKSYKL